MHEDDQREIIHEIKKKLWSEKNDDEMSLLRNSHLILCTTLLSTRQSL